MITVIVKRKNGEVILSESDFETLVALAAKTEKLRIFSGDADYPKEDIGEKDVTRDTGNHRDLSGVADVSALDSANDLTPEELERLHVLKQEYNEYRKISLDDEDDCLTDEEYEQIRQFAHQFGAMPHMGMVKVDEKTGKYKNLISLIKKRK